MKKKDSNNNNDKLAHYFMWKSLFLDGFFFALWLNVSTKREQHTFIALTSKLFLVEQNPSKVNFSLPRVLGWSG
jgi:hypothetical protein